MTNFWIINRIMRANNLENISQAAGSPFLNFKDQRQHSYLAATSDYLLLTDAIRLIISNASTRNLPVLIRKLHRVTLRFSHIVLDHYCIFTHPVSDSHVR